jgi:hypothetical protein
MCKSGIPFIKTSPHGLPPGGGPCTLSCSAAKDVSDRVADGWSTRTSGRVGWDRRTWMAVARPMPASSGDGHQMNAVRMRMHML